MKKDILIDFLDEHIELKTSFDELKKQIIIPSIKHSQKSVLWFKILIPVLTCLFVIVLGIGMIVEKNDDSNPFDFSAPPVDSSFSGLTPYQGDASRIIKKQYELSQKTKKQTIFNYLDGDNVIYELSYQNGRIPDSYLIVYMPTEGYNALENKEMDGSIINDLISKNHSLNELKWFTSSIHRNVKVIQSSYHLAAIYAVGKVNILNSSQQTLNQLSYLKPLNISLESQMIQLEEMDLNLSNYWFMISSSTDVTAWKGYLEDYVTSGMKIAEIENSIVEFYCYNVFDCSISEADFINYLDAFHIELAKYHYEGLLKYIENYKER